MATEAAAKKPEDEALSVAAKGELLVAAARASKVNTMSKRYKKHLVAPAKKDPLFEQLQKTIQEKEKRIIRRNADLEEARNRHVDPQAQKEDAVQAFAETRYVDKHRSVAFGAGQKDLALDIKNKMKRDRRRERRTADVDTQWGIFYKEGLLNLSRNALGPALRNLSASIVREDEHEAPFIARATCYLRMGRPEKAVDDASKAIKIYQRECKQNTKPTASQGLSLRNTLMGALHVKGEALYTLHDFEHALATFHKCVHIRPDLANKFKRSITKSTDAILNTIGADCFGMSCLSEAIAFVSRNKMTTVMRMFNNPLTKYVRRVQANLKCESKFGPAAAARRRPTASAKKLPTGIKRYISSKRHFFVSEGSSSLGELGVDYGFLEELMAELMADSHVEMAPDCSVAQAVTAEAADAIQFLDMRKQFWRHENPKLLKISRPRKELRF